MSVSGSKPVRTRNYRLRQWYRHDDYRLVTERRNFQASNLRGEHVYWHDIGRLPVEHRDSYRRSTYAVYSYATPIAWWCEADGWTQPSVRYSQSTSVHQSTIALAIWAGTERIAS